MARAIMARAITASGEGVVVQAVPTVAAAMAFLATGTVEFILLDINLPGVDGLTALPDLLVAAPGAKVVVVSSAAEGIQALALGAAEVLAKPGPADYTRRFSATLVDTLTRLSAPAGTAVPSRATAAKPLEPIPASRKSQSIVPPPSPTSADFDLVAIGASTGGIHALSLLLREIPASCRVPILITQHLPASFMPYFAAQLTVLAGRPCDVAIDRLRVRPGRMVVAPGDAHMVGVRLPDGGTAIRLSHDQAASGCLPSVDPMLTSLVAIHGNRLLTIILSGMGRDGSDGARAAHAVGGCVVAQDSASSVVWGMPGAVVAAGA
ncbi:chemotaxis protein CheB, partial [Sphingomonas bacterium]|uniref:chemotaxis protein CheB n=1 Tax=Sphingomonas bacterium TaxID=1895847 RepID=UPI0020C61B40